ncbi:hypothetical protein [Rugamonas sp. DEMB1]|uniref:hypothetical protein n=1 Tax=Rugamonas sp. DEMB1 TaxID=3039386 RepID=UPI00244C17F7|nr:hypothetical protein [Rugamonas sp. DEMB1]WGG48714.1 hypothetical protein QC826_18865 [Rugamonas sp. DEMB1]
MTTRITVAADHAMIGDMFYNGLGTGKHPTYAWEAITQVNSVDGLIQLITGHLESHGEFWFEPDESVVVVRRPPIESKPATAEPHKQRTHGH